MNSVNLAYRNQPNFRHFKTVASNVYEGTLTQPQAAGQVLSAATAAVNYLMRCGPHDAASSPHERLAPASKLGGALLEAPSAGVGVPGPPDTIAADVFKCGCLDAASMAVSRSTTSIMLGRLSTSFVRQSCTMAQPGLGTGTKRSHASLRSADRASAISAEQGPRPNLTARSLGSWRAAAAAGGHTVCLSIWAGQHPADPSLHGTMAA